MSSVVLVCLTYFEPWNLASASKSHTRPHFYYFFGNSNNLLLPPNLFYLLILLPLWPEWLIHVSPFFFGIKGKALSWLQSYLTDRSQSVQIDGFTSSVRPLRFDVPQGSVLGPLLYLLYTAPLGDLIRWHDMNFHLHADDTQLYTTFSCDNKDDVTTTISRIESCHQLDDY